jgi:trehalose 6-phosphate synthase/phosphatase
LKRYDVTRWASDFLNGLVAMREVRERIQAKLITRPVTLDIIRHYRESGHRAVFLDYDGTVAPLARYPSLAVPDESILRLLRSLASDPKNSVVIISGRDRQNLEEWFGRLPIGIIAEHGVWLKKAGQPWQILKPINNEWKRDVLPILETYADRLPGALVEEKEHSIAWHYRLADPEQARFLAAELSDHLLNLTAKSDLQVIHGTKVVEIRNAGVNKGSAALEWMVQDHFEFILAVGDDATDEDLFRSLPENAVSIRVGIAGTHARHNVRNTVEVIDLLRSLARASQGSTEAEP